MKPVVSVGPLWFALLCALFSLPSSAGTDELSAALTPILASPLRSDNHRARDQYRHPAATLAFFQVQPQHTVVEIWPGAKGWYTEILAPLLRPQGKLYCAHWAQDSTLPYFQKARAQFDQKLAQAPQVYDRVVVTVLEPPGQISIAPPATADRVLTFRNVHNWLKAGTAATVFAAMYDALKPGGLLGVVEHRAVAGTAEADMISSGYVTEARVEQLAREAGFELVASSEINANPGDDSHHPNGVWSLPPSLRGGDSDRSVYLAIGESDRMTLTFRKPDSSGR
jgi:predicted methyltransferase